MTGPAGPGDATDGEIARHWLGLTHDQRIELVEALPDDEVAVLAAALEAEGISP